MLLRHRTHRRRIRVVGQGVDVRAAATEHKIVDPVERKGIEPAAVRRAVARVAGRRIAPVKAEATRIAAGRVVRRQIIADRQGRITIVDRQGILPTAVAPIIMPAIEAELATARTAAGQTTTPATEAEPMPETTVEATPMLAIEERVVRQITISRREARPSR